MIEDPFVCNYVRNVLVRRGYEFLEANLVRAIEMVQSDQVKISLLITNTPGPFLPFADRMPLLYMAACPDVDVASRFKMCRILPKPFHTKQLVAAVKELAGSS